jgi:hypothetical protein
VARDAAVGAGIVHEDHVEAAIGGVAGRVVDAVVRRGAGHHEILHAQVAQVQVERRRGEGTRRVLVDHQLGRPGGQLGAHFEPG